jgi:hypothetical protein
MTGGGSRRGAEQATAFTEEAGMAQFDSNNDMLMRPGGTLSVRQDDEIARKLMMLIEGECEVCGPLRAARKFGYSKQRYFQLRARFRESGALGLQSEKRGPKTNYRRTAEVVRQVIRHRFLDSDASADVIAQKLRQTGWVIATRSVERIFAEYGLQKKTLQVSPPGRTGKDRRANHAFGGSARGQRSLEHRARRPTATGRQDQ